MFNYKMSKIMTHYRLKTYLIITGLINRLNLMWIEWLHFILVSLKCNYS